MRLLLRIIMTFLLLTLVFTGAVTAAFSIPTRVIEQRVRASVDEVTTDGKMFTTRLGLLEPYKLGTFSDCVILGIAYCADSSQPLQSAMSAKFFIKDSSPVKGAQQMLQDTVDSKLQPVIYSRYWHGNQTVVRPLLCVTDVHGIRIINIVLMAALLLLLFLALWKRVKPADALIITLLLAVVMIPSVPLCLNYVPTFYIALVASLLILWWKRVTARWDNTVVLFFVIGATTAFMDLLTTPMVAMAVPLTVYMLYRRPERAWRTVIFLSLVWLAGYGLLWATKWALAALITGHAAFQDAMGAVTQRTVGHGEQDYMRWCLKMTLMALAATAVVVTVVTALLRCSREALRRHSWMLLVAMFSFVWAFVLLEHTWHHLHFTWRTFVVLAIGVTLFWHHILSPNPPSKR